MINRLLWVGLLLLSFTLLFCSCNTQHYNYKVEDYTLTLEPKTNSPDVKVTLEITYVIEANEPKSDGFKFVGENTVDSLTCWDETGVIPSKVDYLKETRISYQFNRVASGTKKIKATFILRDFIKTQDNKFVIEAPWAGVFRVPVINARYCIILPNKSKNLKFKEPEKWDQETYDKLYHYVYLQSPLKKKTIKVKFER